MRDKDIRYCGECKDFLYEDTNGYGICARDNENYSCSAKCEYGLLVKSDKWSGMPVMLNDNDTSGI